MSTEQGTTAPTTGGRISQAAKQLLGSASNKAVATFEKVREPLRDYRAGLRGEGTLEHGDRIPRRGAVILLANHRHLLDARVLQAHLEREARLVDVEKLARAVQERRGHEVERSDAWLEALAALSAGEMLLLFPEGEPSPDALLHKGRQSIGWLLLAALRLDVPVTVLPLAHDVRQGRIVVGEPLDFSRHDDLVPNRTLARGVVDEVMDALAGTGGFVYSDTHTTTARDQLRSAVQRRRDARKVEALTRRDAERKLTEMRREESRVEREDLAERSRLAAEEARRLVAEAAARDQARRGQNG